MVWNFRSFSAVFQSYQGDGRVNMKVMKRRLGLEIILLPVGFEPETP